VITDLAKNRLLVLKLNLVIVTIVVELCVCAVLCNFNCVYFYCCPRSAYRTSDLGNKGIILCSLYIKAKELQCSSLAKDPYILLTILQ